ncbi:MAG TPA: hypothetical protein VKS79_17665 [Gemmataceae bacterium]|nr:hypothetical protein [Gemmataceae bacterium]
MTDRILQSQGSSLFGSDVLNDIIVVQLLAGIGTGILAWVWGHNCARLMATGKMETGDSGMTRVGKVMGQVVVLIWAAFLLTCATLAIISKLAFWNSLQKGN